VNQQHLSDEAVAAYADGVLSGAARERARRHAESCAECAHAVRVQREAMLALRTAPAPALPTDLLARLRAVPTTTPINVPPTVLGPDGTPMFPAYGTPPPRSGAPFRLSPMAAAAIVAAPRGGPSRIRPLARTAVAVAAAGAVAVASSAPASGVGQGPSCPSSVSLPGR
jgi:Putative zinc-finger